MADQWGQQEQWNNDSYQNGAGYEEEQGETYAMEDQGGGGYDEGVQPLAGGSGGSQDAGSLFRSEEMALCQLFLQVKIRIRPRRSP